MPATLPVRILRGRGRGKIGLVRALTGLGPYTTKVLVEGVRGVEFKKIVDLEAVSDGKQLDLFSSSDLALHPTANRSHHLRCASAPKWQRAVRKTRSSPRNDLRLRALYSRSSR